MLCALALLAAGNLSVPSFTAYARPDPESLRFGREGVSGWTNPSARLVWHGWFPGGGSVRVAVRLDLPPGSTARLELSVGRRSARAEASGREGEETVDFGDFPLPGREGWVAFELSCRGPLSADARVLSLELSGDKAGQARFNLTERRNAASVHIGYPLPDGARAAWFYNEVEAVTDPLHTFYMACGFRRGYFGMQVNSPTERRVIFSVWDSGDEAVDRSRVPEENRVRLLRKGPGVFAGDFGNEGTGGHSHAKVPWVAGRRYAFLLNARPVGDKTVYTAWYRPVGEPRWTLVASFLAPKDGRFLEGLHSFNENFWGTNGDLLRRALFGPAWIRTPEGTWLELTEARFTHDGHGRENRLDYSLRVVDGRFELSNGGFVGGGVRYGDRLRRPAAGRPPVLGSLFRE
ncbi:MAG: DUF3472 domain-containing protein [Fimbriimonadaceae bacterium]